LEFAKREQDLLFSVNLPKAGKQGTRWIRGMVLGGEEVPKEQTKRIYLGANYSSQTGTLFVHIFPMAWVASAESPSSSVSVGIPSSLAVPS